MSHKPLPGVRDFYPDEFAERAHIFGVWRRVAARYGFVEYDGPPLEPLELYTAKSGAEIVEQLYNFTDKGGREISLRPEMTPTVARMVAARVQLAGQSLAAASHSVVFDTLKKDDGGIIAVDRDGVIVMMYNSEGMYRAAADSTGQAWVGVFEEEVR